MKPIYQPEFRMTSDKLAVQLRERLGAIEIRNAELEAAIAAYAQQRSDDIREICGLRAELARHQESEFHPDWSLLEATRESLREHQELLRAAMDELRRVVCWKESAA